MKKWLEDNWFIKLRESFERYYAEFSELSRLEEARTSDGSKTLKAENLAEFPKVFRDLFHLSSPELTSVEDDTDLTQEVILPQRFTAIEAALKSIVKSAIVCRKDCEEIASVFVDNLVETVINLYLKTAEDCIEYRRLWTLDKLNDNLDYRRLKKQEKIVRCNCMTKLEWCRANAPDALKDEDDATILEMMSDAYDREHKDAPKSIETFEFDDKEYI